MPHASRFFALPFIPRLCLSTLAACTLAALGSSPAWARNATLATTATPCEAGAYQGYRLQGTRPSPQLDLDWQRRVRAVRTEAGCLRYALRAAPRLGLFDSIETLPLDGGVLAFVAHRQEKAWLYSALGQDMLPGEFGGRDHVERLAARSGKPAATRVRVKGPEPGQHRYVLLRAGRPVAESPQSYVEADPGQATGSAQAYRRLALHPVRAAAAGGLGLMDGHTLREVLPTRYDRVGVLSKAQNQPWLLYGALGAQGPAEENRAQAKLIEFYGLDGQPKDWPEAQAFAHQTVQAGKDHYLSLQVPAGPAGEGRLRCHYIHESGRALLTDVWPSIPDGQACPALSVQEPLRFADAQGQVHRFAWQAAGRLKALGPPVAGELLAQHQGRFVLRRELPAEAAAAAEPTPAPVQMPVSGEGDMGASPPAPQPVYVYHVMRDDGQPLVDAQGFEGFEDAGCGTWRVRRDGVWYQLDAKGQLSTQMTQPFSC